jgi:tetratricopeptide (TPR) repeat protein
MHIYFMSLQPINSIQDMISQADEAAAASDNNAAIKLYQKVLSENPLNEYVYSRLMILYRKEKDFKSELKVINAGIKAYEEFYTPKKKSKSRLVTSLSNKLNRLVGLADKKGKRTYEPEPIAKWKKRREIVRKKI